MRTPVIASLLGLTLAAGALSGSGCVIGAPPGFSEGSSWSLPLVDPLSDGRLVTAITVDGKGPFLFILDPDARFTTADQALAGIVGITAKSGARLTDEHDTTHPTWYAQIPNIKLGTLEISLLRIGLVENNRYNLDGRRIWGVIGRDVIADSLVYTIDRDRGEVRITVNDKFVAPPGAQVIPYDKLVPRPIASPLPGGGDVTQGLLPSTRYLVKADVDGKRVLLHLDLGDVPSQLLPQHWDAAQLQSSPWPMDLIDEAGTHRQVTTDGIAQHVVVPGEDGTTIARENIGFVPFEDKRWISGQIDGTLGLDFFRRNVVSADWQHQLFYVSPRQQSPAMTAQRLGRWGTALVSQCKFVGCASASALGAEPPPSGELGMAAPDAPGAQAPVVSHEAIFHVERDPTMTGHNLELVLSATAADGKPLPQVYVDLDALTANFDAPIDPRYANAHFEVIDLSPFPRQCANRAPSCMHIAPPVAP